MKLKYEELQNNPNPCLKLKDEIKSLKNKVPEDKINLLASIKLLIHQELKLSNNFDYTDS